VDEICDIDITAPDPEWLATFTRTLVEDRLAASGNLTTPVQSIYRWRDGIEEATEAKVVLHTRRTLVPAIIERLENEHPYDIPGIRIIPVTASDAYHQWVLDSTRPPHAPPP
jgi:periplasmic divalent cation tolerance protein